MEIKMKSLLVALTVLVSSVSYASDSNPFSGKILLKQCDAFFSENKKQNNSYEAKICRESIKAISLGYYGNRNDEICEPKITSHKNVIKIAYQYLQNHPEDLNNYRGSLVGYALKEAFPCNQKIASQNPNE